MTSFQALFCSKWMASKDYCYIFSGMLPVSAPLCFRVLSNFFPIFPKLAVLWYHCFVLLGPLQKSQVIWHIWSEHTLLDPPFLFLNLWALSPNDFQRIVLRIQHQFICNLPNSRGYVCVSMCMHTCMQFVLLIYSSRYLQDLFAEYLQEYLLARMDLGVISKGYFFIPSRLFNSFVNYSHCKAVSIYTYYSS